MSSQGFKKRWESVFYHNLVQIWLVSVKNIFLAHDDWSSPSSEPSKSGSSSIHFALTNSRETGSVWFALFWSFWAFLAGQQSKLKEKLKNLALNMFLVVNEPETDFEGSELRENQSPCAKKLFFIETNHICTDELLQKTDSQRLLRPWLDMRASLVFFGQKWPFSRCLHQVLIFTDLKKKIIWVLLRSKTTA
jgi:hypothetical protein